MIKSSIVLICFLLIGCSEYRDHFYAIHSEHRDGEYREITESGSEIFILPDVTLTSQIAGTFDNSKDRIWVQIYTWTERDTIEALIRAHDRGVDVRVLLEGNVYQIPWINNQTKKKLESAGIDIRYTENDLYRFTHAKFWITDQRYCISTGNFTYTSFQKNRDIIFCEDDPTIIRFLEEIFLADQGKRKPYFSDPIPKNLALAPENMRSRLTEYIQNAKKSIIVYVQSLSDPEILELLESRYQEGIDIRVCVAQNDSIQSLSGYSFPVLTGVKPYLHAKALLIDGEDVFVGSVNLTQNGIDNNREVGIYSQKSEKYYQAIKQAFGEDCSPPKFAK